MKTLKNISYYLAAAIISRPLGFFLSYTLARSMEPVDFGVWLTLMLIIAYGPIAGLGTVETLLKEVPFYIGRGNAARAREVEGDVLGSVVLSACTTVGLGLAALALSPFLSLGLNPTLILAMFVASAFGHISGYFYNRLAAHENFKATGLMDLTRATLTLLFTGGGAWFWGLPGAVVGYMLHEMSMSTIMTVLSLRLYGGVHIAVQQESLRRVIRIGLPITLLWWVMTLSNTVDRVVLGSLLGPLAVGHYGFGISLTGALGLIPAAVGRVLYPQVNRQVGGNVDQDTMKKIVFAPTLALAVLLVNIQIVLLVIMPLLYNRFLPKYQPGLLSGEVLVLGAYCVCMLRNGANYLIASNQEKIFLTYIIFTLVFNVFSDVAFVKAGLGIEGVALGTSLAGVLLTSTIWRKVLHMLGNDRRQVWVSLGHLYLPLILLVGVSLGLHFAYRPAFRVFDAYTVLCAPVLFIVVNGLLFCFPVYRNEAKRWQTKLAEMISSRITRTNLAAIPAE